jgi:aminoglycoside/choline kinase family phosphotransferase
VLSHSLQPQFDATLYRWEQGYFFENCLQRFFKVAPDKVAVISALPALNLIADRLAGRSRVLVHRDFQSQNIIVRESETYLIDFQGMRPGLAEYDLASLLFDPYVELSSAEREELLDFYVEERARRKSPAAHDLRQTFCLCAIQRLMQALGAYGFLGLVKGNKTFLPHIAPAMQSLRSVVAGIHELDSLGALLESVR